MQPKHRRLLTILIGAGLLGSAAFLILNAFEENLVFFVTPADLEGRQIEEGQRFRIGGLVEDGSIVKVGMQHDFTVTDLTSTVRVTYEGLLPSLFKEGQGVVIEGSFGASGIFEASNVLAKHDETYMPEEVTEALKASGQWQGDGS